MPYISQVDTIMWHPIIRGIFCNKVCREDCYIYKGKVKNLTHMQSTFSLCPDAVIEQILEFSPKQIIISAQPGDAYLLTQSILDSCYKHNTGKCVDITAQSFEEVTKISDVATDTVHTISLSSLPLNSQSILQEFMQWKSIQHKKNIQVNLNLIASTGTRLDSEAIQLYGVFDSIYLILKKPPLGEIITNYTINIYRQVSLQLASLLPNTRVYTDRCIHSLDAQITKGTTCQAGMKSLHIWPSGIVTGCPYDTNLLHSYKEHTLRESIKACVEDSLNRPWYKCGLCNESTKQQAERKKKTLLQQILED